ncbi:MAG: hypothetical protein LBT01_08050 [Spirochaetaceae bacterium]|nr:hypothetical protein [Spirochaetaceae bacterium]
MKNKSPDFVRYLSRYQDFFQMKSDRLLGVHVNSGSFTGSNYEFEN